MKLRPRQWPSGKSQAWPCCGSGRQGDLRQGFWLSDVEKKLPVTTDTLFAIGSISKSFTSLVFATLNDEGKVDWDTPVRTYLPTFQLFDPIATDHATPRDMFSHRTVCPAMISCGIRPTLAWKISSTGCDT